MAVAAVLSACASVPPTGPLGQPGPDAAWGWSASLEVDHRFADGQILLFVPEGVEVVIKDVEPLVSGEGLEPLGAMVVGPERDIGTVQQVDSWPPSDLDLGVEPTEAVGAELAGDLAADPDLPEGRGWELLVGYRVVEAGRTTVQGYRVTYEHEGSDYSLVVPSTLAVCAVESADDGDDDCEPEHEVDFDHEPEGPDVSSISGSYGAVSSEVAVIPAS